MADTQIRPPCVTFINSKRTVGGGSNFVTPVNYTSVTALRTALAAANNTYYTAAKLNQLSVNDMVFALRSIQDPKTIADYMSAQTA